MTNSPITGDLNEVIAGAVQARIEASVLEAMSSNETFSAFVVAALQQPIEVGGPYDKRKTTFLAETIRSAVRDQTKAVVQDEIGALEDKIREEVRKALRKSVGVIADSLVDGFVASSSGRYPSVKVEFNGQD